MNEDQDRVAGIERIPMSRAPERDLWPGIHARLRPRKRFRLPVALAASLVAGLAAVIGLSRMPAGPGAEAPFATALPAQALTVDARAIVEANLGMVQSAERQLRRALEQDPESPALRALLANAVDRQQSLRQLL